MLTTTWVLPARRATARAAGRTRVKAIALTAAAAVLAGCAGGAPAGAGAPADGEAVPITMGVLPIVPSAALQLGVDQGIFAEHGFDVELSTGKGGAELLPAVVAGETQFAISNPLTIMVAQEQGVPVRMVTGYSSSKTEGEDVNSVWAAPDSGIESAGDLAGKVVAVNTLRTMGEVSIREVVEADGGDPATINFVELGFPDMPAALDRGDIDAAWVPEPFQTVLAESGNVQISANYQETMPGVPTMVVVTGSEQDPELVAAFAAAVDEVTAYAEAHDDELRATLADFLEMEPALAESVVLEDFRADVDADALQALADMALANGVLTEPVDVAAFVP
ncbi:ABC transporter substrate-binding protein [Promicromonospora sp. Populi]|uniref:ABC transporter substrate-binding protein n=1 Tax=Promicromonospora sp. Populi TaxID=3239420 RepID=UPI0034E1F702